MRSYLAAVYIGWLMMNQMMMFLNMLHQYLLRSIRQLLVDLQPGIPNKKALLVVELVLELIDFFDSLLVQIWVHRIHLFWVFRLFDVLVHKQCYCTMHIPEEKSVVFPPCIMVFCVTTSPSNTNESIDSILKVGAGAIVSKRLRKPTKQKRTVFKIHTQVLAWSYHLPWRYGGEIRFILTLAHVKSIICA